MKTDLANLPQFCTSAFDNAITLVPGIETNENGLLGGILSLSTKTLKMLWGRAGGRCSLCRKDVFVDEVEADSPSLVGENCHIVAESDGGPRSDAAMPLDERNSYSNLILLCRNDHKRIDDSENGENIYPIHDLHKMKKDHEEWVRTQLGFDAAKQEDEENYAQIIERWEKLCHVDDWLAWSSHMLGSGQPRMRIQLSEDLEAALRFLLTRIWPGRHPPLEDAFENFRRALEALHNKFLEHSEERGELLQTTKFYKIPQWDDQLYRQLLREYGWHVDFVMDLMLELTRAANLVCDLVRTFVLKSYRRSEGRLLVQMGPLYDFSFKEWVVAYSQAERSERHPFKGVESFITDRITRDDNIGSGPSPE